MKHALLNTSNELQRVQDFTDTPPALPEAKGLRWLEYVDTPQPGYNQMTQRLDPTVTVDSKYTKDWQIVALDADTIAANRARVAQELQQSIVTAVQQRLDTFANTRGYSSPIVSANIKISLMLRLRPYQIRISQR